MAIAEEDELIVDLVVGGLSPAESRESAANQTVDARRLNAVARFFKLMDQLPATEPPRDLIESTLRRVAQISKR